MKSMKRVSVWSLVAAGVYLFAVVVVNAQAKTATSGVYSEAQAKRGEGIYKEQCAACHGDNLEGSGPMPPLAGKDFLANWGGKPVAEVFDKTQTSMPATAPGSLTPEQTADVIAYMLSVGKYPAGAADLPGKADDLKQITLDAPK
jgi:S-disulfanyl-L-cysteine oxidoreductase SoxD